MGMTRARDADEPGSHQVHLDGCGASAMCDRLAWIEYLSVEDRGSPLPGAGGGEGSPCC